MGAVVWRRDYNFDPVHDDPSFVCKDCGASVYDALGEDRERCHPCQWVADIPDEAERAKILAWLIEVGAIDGGGAS